VKVNPKKASDLDVWGEYDAETGVGPDEGWFKPVPMRDGLPNYPLGRIARLRREFEDKVHFQRLQDTLADKEWDAYIADIVEFFGFNERQQAVLTSSLMDHYGEVLSDRLEQKLQARIVGGCLDIMAGTVLQPESEEVLNLWVPCEVVDFRYTKRLEKLQLFSVRLYALAGVTAGRVYDLELAVSFFHRIKYDLGWPQFKKADPKEFFGCRFLGLYEETKRGNTMTHFKLQPSMKAHNQKLRSDRSKDCPIGKHWECDECYIGLDKCDRACHLRTYTAGDCRYGHRGYMDPMSKSKDICIGCQERQARRMK